MTCDEHQLQGSGLTPLGRRDGTGARQAGTVQLVACGCCINSHQLRGFNNRCDILQPWRSGVQCKCHGAQAKVSAGSTLWETREKICFLAFSSCKRLPAFLGSRPCVPQTLPPSSLLLLSLTLPLPSYQDPRDETGPMDHPAELSRLKVLQSAKSLLP